MHKIFVPHLSFRARPATFSHQTSDILLLPYFSFVATIFFNHLVTGLTK